MTNKDLEQLITEYGKDIYSFCVHLTGNRDIADDLYQETFLVAVNRRRTLVKIEEPKAYLLSVAVHVWTNMKRKYARRMGIAPETSYDDALLAEVNDHTDEANCNHASNSGGNGKKPSETCKGYSGSSIGGVL